jgi:hypothetical protein
LAAGALKRVGWQRICTVSENFALFFSKAVDG